MGPFDPPAAQTLLGPVEIQRRLRVFAEDYLNKEVDIFFSLLPDRVVTDYLSSFFSEIGADAAWTVHGNSNEIEMSFDMLFMQIDTIAYSHNTATLVGLEQKVDAAFNASQLLKYCFMAAHLEDLRKTEQGTRFNLLLIEAVPTAFDEVSLRRSAIEALDRKEYPKNRLDMARAERLAPVSGESFRTLAWPEPLGNNSAITSSK